MESGYVGGAFPPAISRTVRTTTGWKVHGGGRGQAAAKGGLQYGRLEGWPGPREKLGQAGNLARAVVAAAAVVVGVREEVVTVVVVTPPPAAAAAAAAVAAAAAAVAVVVSVAC